MSHYRIALLLCRSLSNFFFWSAAFGLLSLSGGLMGYGVGGALSSIVSLVSGALLRFFAVTIASTLVGQSAFEGEALSKDIEKETQFRILVRSFTGILLLVFGANYLLSTVLSFASSYSIMGRSGYAGIYIVGLIAPFLQIALGLYLAFGGALKRLSQTMTGVELASPDESESKRDSSP